MTPTPEMEAFAREIATKHFGTSRNGLMIRLMSVAIMETSVKHCDALREARKGIPETVNRKMRTLELSIRNGEHLR